VALSSAAVLVIRCDGTLEASSPATGERHPACDRRSARDLRVQRVPWVRRAAHRPRPRRSQSIASSPRCPPEIFWMN